MGLSPASSQGGGGGGGTVTSVTAADTSIVVGGTAAAPTIATGTLDVIATDHPPVASVPMNGHKHTSLAAGTGAGDSIRYEQVLVANVVPVASLVAGAAGQVLGGTVPSYSLPPGFEVNYVALTASVAILGTSAGSSTTITGGTPATFENVPYLLEFYTPQMTLPSTTGGSVTVLAFNTTTAAGLGEFVATNDITGGQSSFPFTGKVRFTPAAGTATIEIVAWVSATTGSPSVGAGAGGLALANAYLRITKC